MAKAKDMMTQKPLTLSILTTIQAAADFFSEKKFSSVPVTTSTGEVIGQLTELTLVRALVLHQLQPGKYKQLSDCVEMMEDAFFVMPGDSVTMVIQTILKSPTRRVLVKSNGPQILGIISPKDLLKFLMSDDPKAKAAHAEIEKLQTKKM